MSDYEYVIDDHRVLSRAEERTVFEIYKKTRSVESRNFIIKHNIKFAIQCGNAYITKFPHVDPLDLRSYAILGLYDGIEKYDTSTGNKFISYAVWWIKASIMKNVHTNESLVRLPANIHQEMQKAVNKNDMDQRILNFFNTIGGGMSMDATIGTGNDLRTLGDTISDDNALRQFNNLDVRDIKEKILIVIDSALTTRERYIITEYFGMTTGESRTLSDIGKEFGMSREHTRNIKNKAFEKLYKCVKHWK
jgi:RNA polymerase primary sigma factor